jgi:hypothetical protein
MLSVVKHLDAHGERPFPAAQGDMLVGRRERPFPAAQGDMLVGRRDRPFATAQGDRGGSRTRDNAVMLRAA